MKNQLVIKIRQVTRLLGVQVHFLCVRRVLNWTRTWVPGRVMTVISRPDSASSRPAARHAKDIRMAGADLNIWEHL